MQTARSLTTSSATHSNRAIGPNVIARLNAGLAEFLDRNAHRGWTCVEDFRGMRRDRIVANSQIRRPVEDDYHGGYEGYAPASDVGVTADVRAPAPVAATAPLRPPVAALPPGFAPMRTPGASV